MGSISSKADVDARAILGKNVTIESFAKIDNNVEIGEGCWIGAGVTIYEGARIGKNCRIFPGAVISAEPQDLKYKGEKTLVEIGDDTTIREYVTINKGTASKGFTKVGSHCLLMAYSHVAHDCVLGDHVILSNGVQIAGEVKIGNWAIIGGNSAVHQFCQIGEHAMVSGMSGVLSDVPPYITIAGMPAIYHGINYVGLKRRSFSKEQIDTIHAIYRTIFQEGYNTSQAVEHIQAVFKNSEEKTIILKFISASSRGIIKAPSKRKDVRHEITTDS